MENIETFLDENVGQYYIDKQTNTVYANLFFLSSEEVDILWENFDTVVDTIDFVYETLYGLYSDYEPEQEKNRFVLTSKDMDVSVIVTNLGDEWGVEIDIDDETFPKFNNTVETTDIDDAVKIINKALSI